MSEKYVVPIWEKYSLTVEEVAAYFRIGEQKLRRIADEKWNGNRPQFKRKNSKNTLQIKRNLT